MSPTLEKRRASGLPPFSGVTLHPESYLGLSELAASLRAIVSVVEEDSPKVELILDGHEAGCPSQELGPMSWPEVRRHLGDLYAWRTGELLLCRGLLAGPRPVYVRLYIADDGERHREAAGGQRFGEFDVTASSDVVARIRGALSAMGLDGVCETEATEYFMQRSSEAPVSHSASTACAEQAG